MRNPSFVKFLRITRQGFVIVTLPLSFIVAAPPPLPPHPMPDQGPDVSQDARKEIQRFEQNAYADEWEIPREFFISSPPLG